MSLPHVLKRIVLHLARSREFPTGSLRHGYEFVAPLDSKGHIDPHLWHENKDHCRVRRFREGEDDKWGRLVHRPGGAEHARWMFDYGPGGDGEESGYHFGTHAFVPGEYVSIRGDDGDTHTLQVASVQPAT